MQDLQWEQLEVKEVIADLRTDKQKGLSQVLVDERLDRYGTNILEEGERITILEKIIRQFKNPLVSILLVAGVFTIILAEYIDATVIFIALLINVVVGVFQEERASRAFEKLNQSQEHFATVIRGGRKILVRVEELVPGDIIEMQTGQYVPADVRIVSEKNLSINESALTGEWVAVPKNTEKLKEHVALAARNNMAWRGTFVVEGFGIGVVVATGSRTQVGRIAHELGAIEEHTTPLQQNIQKVARFISIIVAVSIVTIFLLGVFRGASVEEMLLVSIAVAVAAIPSGLPAAVTVVLAIGMETILKRGGLVRNLLAAETLGSTTIILTDKTGTLTEAKMKLARVYTLENLRLGLRDNTHPWNENEKYALKAAVLASDAFVEEQDEQQEQAEGTPKELIVRGRPIEKAVVLAGLSAGLSQRDLEKDYKQLDYLQFESKRRFGGSLNTSPEGKVNFFYITGSPEMLLECATHVYHGGKKIQMTYSMRKDFARLQARESGNGMRFIGVAEREVKWRKIPQTRKKGEEIIDVTDRLTDEITFLAFLSFEDPVRADVPAAIAEVKQAGADVMMVTGDNPETARKIACDVGITCERKYVYVGADIEKCKDDEALFALIKKAKVFARTLPEQKLRIVRLLKNKGEVVAMTGDGVNDAPALRSANIGVAVGSGTEVAKEASDMILLNNSFSIIVGAIEEGRRIIDNLKKIVAYLLSTSFSEIFIIGGALAVGAPLPFVPAQILWANIIEEGLMSFSFAFEKKNLHIMRRNPREHSSRNIMTHELKFLIALVSAVTGIFLVGLYFFLLSLNLPLEEVRTVMFVSLSLDAIFFSFSLKSLHRPIWRINIFSNRFLIVALLVSIGLLLLALALEPLRILLSLTTLHPFEIGLLVFVGLFNLATIEVAKYFLFERPQRKRK